MNFNYNDGAISAIRSMLIIFGCAFAVGCGGSSGDGGSSISYASGSKMTGKVDGANRNYSGDVRYTAAGSKRSIVVENLDNGEESWGIYFIDPVVGNYRCGNASETDPIISIIHHENSKSSSQNGGSCSITISRVDDDQIEGQFTATLINTESNASQAITEGAFHIVFAEVIPDSDDDGLSDADDNCPFDINPAQLDENNNAIGDACEA